MIGASLGGIPALLSLAAELAPEFPCPIVIVQHIGAHPSRLAELLSTRGPNRAVTVQEGQRPTPGTLHVAPSDHHVLIGPEGLYLTRGAKENHSRPAIDPLFRTAALTYGSKAIGVVLTGMLDDGAAGLRAIKACGGTAIVQDPDEAAEPSMPLSAMAYTEVDHVVRLERLAELLESLASKPMEISMTPIPSSVWR